MIDKKRVLLFCDSKWRDLPGISLIRKHLLDMGHSVLVTHLHAWRDTVDLYAPHLVLLPHVQGSRNSGIASHVKRNGGHVLVQFTEGILEFEGRRKLFASQKGNPYVDEFLCWNEETAELVDGLVTGCPRFDLYLDKYDYLVAGANLTLQRHGLREDVPIILFVDSWPSEKFTYSYQQFHNNDFKDLGNTEADEYSDPAKFAALQHKYAQKFRNGILFLMDRFGDDFEFVIRTHPMSDLRQWKKWGYEHGAKVIHRDYIFNLLYAADLVVSKLGSITVPEAWMLGIPVVTLDFDQNVSGATEGQRAAQGIFNYTEFDPGILDAMEMPIHRNLLTKQLEYLFKWGISDESRTERSRETADLIDDIMGGSTLEPLGTPNFIGLADLMMRIDNNLPDLDAFGNWHKTVTHADVLEWGRMLNANA